MPIDRTGDPVLRGARHPPERVLTNRRTEYCATHHRHEFSIWRSRTSTRPDQGHAPADQRHRRALPQCSTSSTASLPQEALRDDRGPPDRPRSLDARVQRGRAPSGKWCFGKTPLQTFLDALPLAKEDGFRPNLFQDMNAGSAFSFKAQRTRGRKRTSARDAGWPSPPRLQ